MKTQWRETTFGEIFEISSSKRVLQADWKTSGVPFYRAREIVKLAEHGVVDNDLFISEELYQEYSQKYGVPLPGDLMISAVGTLGACYIVQPADRFYFKDASVLRFSPKQAICSKYILHAFRTREIIDQVHAGSGSTVGTYTISRANSTKIKLPPLAEQKRIAAVLDAAEALRAKRREAKVLCSNISDSIFIKMFGDPAFNPKEIPKRTLADICLTDDGIKCGPFGTQLAASEFRERGVPLWGIKHVNSMFTISTNEFLDAKTAERLSQYSIARGDIVMTRKGTVGNCAVYLKELQGIMHSDLLRVRVNTKTCDPFYLAHQLQHSRDVEHQLSLISGGAVMPGINVGRLKGLKLIVPSLEKQLEFRNRVECIENLASQYKKSHLLLDTLFASLQHRAFQGDL